MRKLVHKVVLAISIAVIILMAGCEEQNLVRKHRLIADENLQLKEQRKQCEAEIEEHIQEKAALEEQVEKTIDNLFKEALTDMAKENASLAEESNKLKARIQQLEDTLQQSEKELPEVNEPPVSQPL